MVHTFRCVGRVFMLDTESGSLFEIDELTKKVVDRRIAPDEVSEGAFSCYENSEIAAVESEIDELIKEGVLFTPAHTYAKPVYSGIIKAMCLNISHNCNLKCEYCFADGGTYNKERKNMPLDVALKAIDFLVAKSGKRKNLEVDFFGGEPLLNFDVVKKTVAYARSLEEKFGKKFRFTITTNAVLLNDEVTEYCNKEMYNVVVSIDGRKDVHNCVRKTLGGKDSYDMVLKNALRFKELRGDRQYFVRGTFTALNTDFAKDVLALNNLGFDCISVEPVVLPETNRLAIKEEHIEYLKKQYDELAEEYLRRRNTDKHFEFFHFILSLKEGPCEAKRLTGCGAGCEYVAVNPDGNIYPCHQFDGNDSFVIGNVKDGTFETTIPQRFAATNVTTKENCPDCWAKSYCSGGCNANAFNFNGSFDKPYRGACELMRKRIECALAVNSIECEN